jgi:TIR domain
VADPSQPFRVFINYRRSDSGGYAGRIYDALTAHSNEWLVFMDIDAIDPGADFTEVIEESLESCDAVVAVIGRSWLQSTDSRGRRRLEHPDDFVRLELLAALDRKVRVIPVLVQGADMPSSEDLPKALITLARRQGLELSDGRWHYDMSRLIEVLDHYHRGDTPPLPALAPEPGLAPPRNELETQPVEMPREPEPAPVPTSGRVQPADAALAPATTIAAVGAATVFVANFVGVGGGKFPLFDPSRVTATSVWFAIELVAVSIIAAFVIFAEIRHRIRGARAVGMLLGFGLVCFLAGVNFVGYYYGRSTAGWILMIGGVLLGAGGAIGIRSHPEAFVPDRDASDLQHRSARIAVAIGAVLCIAATIVPVQHRNQLLGGHWQAWFALVPLLGAGAALVCLIERRSVAGRLVSAGLQLAIGIQLTLFFLAYVGQISAPHNRSPATGAYLGFAGAILLAVGGYFEGQEQAVVEQSPESATATP